MSACIRIENVTKYYGATLAVDDLSLEIREGEIFGLLGPNGAGKSTTLHMLTGLVRPTSGSISIFDENLRRGFLKVAPRLGVLVERPAFYEHLTVAKNMTLFSRLCGKSVTIDKSLNLVSMLHVSDRKVGELSHGMRQRLGLAIALMTEPELLILDEPTIGLDVEHAQEILHLLRLLADEANVTVVISSHMMHEVESLCDRVAVINEGKLVGCEETDVLLSYDKTLVEVLISAPEAAAKRLREEPWVESIELRPGRILVRLKEPDPTQLITFLVGTGYRISGVIPRRRTLQEYFLKVLNS